MSMNNKIILFTNIKGGVGKTTLCGLFATFCAEKGIPVAVMDADIQQSLFRHRQRELQQNQTTNLPWQIQSISTSDEDVVEKVMKKLKDIVRLYPILFMMLEAGKLNTRNARKVAAITR